MNVSRTGTRSHVSNIVKRNLDLMIKLISSVLKTTAVPAATK